MIETHNVLILTDHSGHSAENSLYAMINAMILHPYMGRLFVASRAIADNAAFFDNYNSTVLWATPMTEAISYSKANHPFEQDLMEINPADFGFIWLRLPPPLGYDFVRFLNVQISTSVIVNDPMGIYETGSKAFLSRFPSLCAPMKSCDSIDDIEQFRSVYPDIILKPNRNYGGSGLVRIQGDIVSVGHHTMNYDSWLSTLNATQSLDLTAVKFLNNVSQGDKRIVVCNGVVIGASLRLPAQGSWICNVAMGGHSNPSEINPEEYIIIEEVNPVLNQKGIVMYGIDTLVGDDGQRLLSEINTTSIGGVPQIAKMNNQPLVEKTIDQIWNYVVNRIS